MWQQKEDRDMKTRPTSLNSNPAIKPTGSSTVLFATVTDGDNSQGSSDQSIRMESATFYQCLNTDHLSRTQAMSSLWVAILSGCFCLLISVFEIRQALRGTCWGRTNGFAYLLYHHQSILKLLWWEKAKPSPFWIITVMVKIVGPTSGLCKWSMSKSGRIWS